MIRKLYQEMAQLLGAIENCRRAGNGVWHQRHSDRLDHLAEKYLPSGSGIDNGTKLDRGRSNPNALVFTFGFHHMDDNGSYTAWTQHTLTVRPDLAHDISVSITGPDRNGIKDYLVDTFLVAIRREIDTGTEYAHLAEIAESVS